jgi:DNA-binding XRE family transcriptional regulator/predicted GIY-YIG superfamily endonuclease
MTDHELYRHFDSMGRLLYVGISWNAKARLRLHKTSKWFSDIARMEVQHFSTIAEAQAAERCAIEQEKPLHNKRYSTTSPQRTMMPQQIITARQTRTARAGLRLTARGLAKEAGVARVTVSRFETEQTELIAATAQAVRGALERRGITFPDLETVRFPKKGVARSQAATEEDE